MATTTANPNITDVYFANHLYTSDGIDRNSLPLKAEEVAGGSKGFYCEHTVNPSIYESWAGKDGMKFCMREINQKEMRDPYCTALNTVEIDSLARVNELAIMPLFSYIKPEKDEDDDEPGIELGQKYGRRTIALVRWLNIPLGTTIWLNKQKLGLIPFKGKSAEQDRADFIETWNSVLCGNGYNIGLYNPAAPLSNHGCCDSNQLTAGSCIKEAVMVDTFRTITIPKGDGLQKIYCAKYAGSSISHVQIENLKGLEALQEITMKRAKEFIEGLPDDKLKEYFDKLSNTEQGKFLNQFAGLNLNTGAS